MDLHRLVDGGAMLSWRLAFDLFLFDDVPSNAEGFGDVPTLAPAEVRKASPFYLRLELQHMFRVFRFVGRIAHASPSRLIIVREALLSRHSRAT